MAIVIGEKLRFQEIEYGDLTGLFGNLNRGRRDYDREANSMYQMRGLASISEHNILSFLSEKNRKKWMAQGRMQPANTRVRHSSILNQLLTAAYPTDFS